MELENLFKNKGMVVVGVIVAAIVLYALFRKSPQTGGSANNAGGQLYYGSGLNPQQALELAGMEVQAQSANLATVTSGKVNLANISALRDVNLAQNETYGNIESQDIAAKQAVALDTNAGNLKLADILAGRDTAIANINAEAAKAINLDTNQTRIALAPSWESQLLNGPGALNLQSQSGSFLKQASGDFVKFWNGGSGGQGFGSFLGGGI